MARGGQHPDGQRPGGQKRGQRPPLWPEAIRAKRVRESFVLRTYVVGRVWKKKLHFDWQVKVVPASQERRDYLKVGMSKDLLPRILILPQTLFIY